MGLFSKLLGPPSKDRFAKLVLRRLRSAGADGLRYDRAAFSILGSNEDQFFLGNSYAEYCRADESQRQTFLDQMVRTWSVMRMPIPDDFEDVRSDLLPAVRARTYLEVDLRRVADNGSIPEIPYEIIADSLCAYLVYDLPTSTATVNQELLHKWGVTFYEAMEIAKQNLRETTKNYAQIGSLYSMVNGDAHDATRLLLVDWLEQMDLKGDPIAMVPNRDTLLVTGADDEEGLSTMLALAKPALSHERLISGAALTLIDGAWEPWTPPAGHPLDAAFAELRWQSAGRDYESQKQLFDARFARQGRDVFVASFTGLQDESSGRVQSFCVWSMGVPSLLPRTDLVFFAEPGADGKSALAARGTWEDVMHVVGHLLQQEVEMYPVRWLTAGFPTDEQLQRISASGD